MAVVLSVGELGVAAGDEPVGVVVTVSGGCAIDDLAGAVAVFACSGVVHVLTGATAGILCTEFVAVCVAAKCRGGQTAGFVIAVALGLAVFCAGDYLTGLGAGDMSEIRLMLIFLEIVIYHDSYPVISCWVQIKNS